MNRFLILPFMFLLFSCNKTIYIPENELIITASYYDSISVYPIPSDNYFLKISIMDNPNEPFNDRFFKYLHMDSVKNTLNVRFTKDNGLMFGRYIISVSKGSLKENLELMYKGGSVQLNLIMK